MGRPVAVSCFTTPLTCLRQGVRRRASSSAASPAPLPRKRIGVGLGMALSVMAAFASCEAAADEFVEFAFDLRARSVAGEDSALDVLTGSSGAEPVGSDEILSAIWRPFFASAIVETARRSTPNPVALYYNPLLDIGLLTFWEHRHGDYIAISSRALPGERLSDPEVDIALAPPGCKRTTARRMPLRGSPPRAAPPFCPPAWRVPGRPITIRQPSPRRWRTTA